MNVPLRPDIEAFVDEMVRSGQYATREDVIQAGLVALRQHEFFGDFISGELNEIIAEGERSLDRSPMLDADEAMRARRARRRLDRGDAG